MDLRGGRRSSNIEDRRGMGIGRTGVHLSIGGILFLIVLSLFGINPLPFLGMATQQQTAPEERPADQPYQESTGEAQYRELAEVTLGETENTWNKELQGKYQAPTMVFYTQ